jgi:predicted nucleic acid-binding protein
VKYAFDTNVFIDGFRTEETQADIVRFLTRALPFTYLSAVVMQELAAGARTPQAAKAMQDGVFEPFERRRRVFSPSSAAFVESGRVIARLAAREGWQPLDEKPSLVNDALIAVSCREVGITLITKDRDFTRLSPLIRGFRYVAPWPSWSLSS